MAAKADGDVIALLDDADDVACREVEFDGRQRVLVKEFRHQLGDSRMTENIGAGNTDQAARLLVQAARRVLQFGNIVQHAAGPRGIVAPCLGEAQATGGAVDQPNAEIVLELPDHPADRRRRHVEIARRGGQAAQQADPVEYPHRRQKIHPGSPLPSHLLRRLPLSTEDSAERRCGKGIPPNLDVKSTMGETT